MSAIEEAKKAIESLPPESGWEEILHELYIRKKLDQAFEDEAAGRVVSHDEVRKRFPSAR